ncbi:MAG: O-antigen ligase family protein [Clostridium argentinense]|nr:O-antigen ligase family protein [Clostridium argentinense]
MSIMSQTIYFLLCVYIVILPLVSESMGKLSKVSDGLLILIMLFYVINMLLSSENRKRFWVNLKDFLSSFLGISMIALSFIMIFSISYSTEKGLSIMETFRFITYIGLIFIIKYEADNKARIKTIIRCFLLTTSFLCIFGIIQYFTGIGLNDKFTGLEASGTVIRITSTMQNPNGFGAYLVLAFFPIVMLSFSTKNNRLRGFYIVLSLLVLANLLLTASRNSIIGLIIGFIVLGVLYSYKFLLVFFLGIPVFLFDKSLLLRFANIKEEILNGPRVKLWQIARMMIKEHPIRGVGNGNYVSLYDEYVKKYPQYKYPDYHRFSSHNSYLKVQSELGIFGIAFFVSTLAASVRTVIRVYKKSKDKYYKYFYMGFMGSTIGFLFMNMLDNLFFSPQTTTYFWVFIGLGEAILLQVKRHKVS